MELILFHPKVAFRDCDVCKKYLFDENTGEIEKNTATKELIERPKGTFPPCHYGPDQCAKVSPESGLQISEKNVEAYWHYKECRAIGSFPADSIVRENAAVIRMVEDQAAEGKQQEFLISVMKSVTATRG